MRICDLFQIAIKNIKGKWAVLFAMTAAVGVFCLCFSGAILTTVEQEKALPHELIVSSERNTGITDEDIRKISEIPDVRAVTAILQVPVSIKTGKYSAQLTLTGMDMAYQTDALSKGGIFPNSSAMPYIVLNDAACKQFSEGEIGSRDEAPEIDWLNAAFSLQVVEDGRWITSKVCGILANNGETQEPAAVISLPVAKELLRKNGQSTDTLLAYVCVANIGRAVSVSKAIATLGLAVSNSNVELQEKWDAEMKEMRYLLVIGVLCLVCSIVLTVNRRKIYEIEQKPTLETLRWLGMNERDIGRLFSIQSVFLSLLGSAVGITASVLLPSFLPPELGETSFALPIPFGVMVVSLMLCIAPNLPHLLRRNGQNCGVKVP